MRYSLLLGGSDATAAGGGSRELSEWQRSVGNAGVRAKESTGHRNSNGGTKCRRRGFLRCTAVTSSDLAWHSLRSATFPIGEGFFVGRNCTQTVPRATD